MTEYLFIPTEDGTEEKFEILYEFERHDTGRKYILVTPTEVEDPDEQEVFAFRYHGENDQMTLEMIEDDEEWKIVEEMFEMWLSDDFQVMNHD